MSHLDILNVDAKIKQKFREEEEKLPEYTQKLYELEQTLNKNIRRRSYQILLSNISELKTKINDIIHSQKLNFYISKTAQLLENYRNILQTPVKLSFMGRDTVDNKEKNKIISKYLEIAEEYIEIDRDNSFLNSKCIVICDNCPNKKLFDIVDNSIYICLICGSQQEILLHTSSYKDVDRVNISSKYTYDRKVHFRDCINQYQGKQNSTIEDDVFTDLIDQFNKHYLLIGDENTPKETRFSKITKEHVHLFLKELEYSKHYENVNLIHYQITGNKPDDISYLHDNLLNDFDILVDLYDKKFKNKYGFDRKNFMNTQYILYQLLIKHKHPCKKEDFTILKTIDRKAFHDDVTKVLFEELGWNMSPLF